MRSLALALLTASAVACGGTPSNGATNERAPEESAAGHQEGGANSLANGGGRSTPVPSAGESGDSPGGAGGAETEANDGGASGAVGGDGGAGGETSNGGASGGTGGASGSGGGSAGASPDLTPWKNCGNVTCTKEGDCVLNYTRCANDEICATRGGRNICLKVPGVNAECQPQATVNDAEFMAQCDSEPIQCSHPYRNCRSVVDTKTRDLCKPMGKDPFTLIDWSCGPPP